jgi:CP family cyanate transporter-like MFS transporter
MATGLWTGAMMLGAAAGGALTAPLAGLLGSWEWALAVWSLPAVAGLAIWLRAEGLHDDPGDPAPAAVHVRALPWRNATAWALTAFIMLNSLTFYTAVAWMAPSFVDRGWTQDEAGFLFGVFTVGQLAGAILMPMVADHIARRRALFAVLVLTCALTALSLGLIDSGVAAVLAVTFGFAIGGAFTMALALLSEFGRDSHASGRLTAMAFFVTYIVAAMGPLAAGMIIDAGAAWPLVFALIAAAGISQLGAVPALRRGSVVS